MKTRMILRIGLFGCVLVSSALGIIFLVVKSPGEKLLVVRVSEADFSVLDAYVRAGDWDGADRLLVGMPHQGQIHVVTLGILKAKGDVALARSEHENPDHIDQAIAYYKEGLDISRKKGLEQESEFLYCLGIGLMKKKSFEEAQNLFEKIIKEFPRAAESFNARIKIGSCYQGMGEPEKATAYFYRWIAKEENPECIKQIYSELTILLEPQGSQVKKSGV